MQVYTFSHPSYSQVDRIVAPSLEAAHSLVSGGLSRVPLPELVVHIEPIDAIHKPVVTLSVKEDSFQARTIVELRGMNASQSAIINDLNRRNDFLNDQNDSLRRSLDNAKTRVADLITDRDALKTEVHQLRTTHPHAETERLVKERNDLLIERAQLRESNDSLTKKLDDVHASLLNARDDLRTVVARVTTLTEENQILLKRNATLGHIVNKVQNVLNSERASS
jgi:chromosome segregation ATPase